MLLLTAICLVPGAVMIPSISRTSGLARPIVLPRAATARMLADAAAWPAGAHAANVSPAGARAGPACMYTTLDPEEVSARTLRLLSAKDASGLSWDELAVKLGLTNAFTVQLFLGQARLSASAAEALTEAVPLISKADLAAMQQAFPMRKWDPALLQEPNVYRTHEAIMHYAEAIKTLINEQCGDGIMSAIDFYLDVGTTTGKAGEKRVVLTFNGKFLPFIEQKSADNSAPSPRD